MSVEIRISQNGGQRERETSRQGTNCDTRDDHQHESASSLAVREPQARVDVSDAHPSFDKRVQVSVVIPCYNEERFIKKVLENIGRQYDQNQYEIIVVDGMSVDKTRQAAMSFMTANPDVQVRLIDNPARNIPAGLNRGIEQARGDIIVRMDAHAIPSANYVRRCVELLNNSGASVVGMPCRVHPGAETLTAHAIALSVSHPFGIGDAKYRLPSSATAQFVDTVAFGTFRKSLWGKLGGFDENLLTNEDYDFNYRVRSLGGNILLDTTEHCDYFARATMGGLARQYFRYGSWKAQMLKLHPRSVRWRHLVAPAFVASIVFFTSLGVLWTPALWALLLIVAAYISLSVTSAFMLSRKVNDFRLLFVIPVAFLLIHVTWGSSFLVGLARDSSRN